MELGSAIFTGLKTFLGVLIPPIKKKYFDQPKIYLVFNLQSASQTPKGLSSKNDLTAPIFVTEAVYNFDLTWDYQISLRNNSEYTAYNLKLTAPPFDTSFKLVQAIDSLKPLSPNNEITTLVRFYLFYEGTGATSNILLQNKPEKLASGEFILEYTNAGGTKFLTKYDNRLEEDKRHDFKIKNGKTQIAIISSTAALIIIAISIIIYSLFKSPKKEPNISVNLKQDAKVIADGISITGWEKTGDYVGYLTQITGFYARHKDKFPTEYDTYKKQLDSWTKFLDSNRDKGKFVYTTDIEGLKGLVSSGDIHLEKIANSKESN